MEMMKVKVKGELSSCYPVERELWSGDELISGGLC